MGPDRVQLANITERDADIFVVQRAFVTCQEICVESNVKISGNRNQNS